MFIELLRQVALGAGILVAMMLALALVVAIIFGLALVIERVIDCFKKPSRRQGQRPKLRDPPAHKATGAATDDLRTFGVGYTPLCARIGKHFQLQSLSLGVSQRPDDGDHLDYLALAKKSGQASPRLLAGLLNDRGYWLAKSNRWVEAEKCFDQAMQLLADSGLCPQASAGEVFALDCAEGATIGLTTAEEASSAQNMVSHRHLQWSYYDSVMTNHETAMVRVLVPDGWQLLTRYTQALNAGSHDYLPHQQRIGFLMEAADIFRRKLTKLPAYRWLYAACLFDIANAAAWVGVDVNGVSNLLKEADKIAQAADEPWLGFRQTIADALATLAPATA